MEESIDQGFENSAQKMQDAVNALLEMGFDNRQLGLIRDYISSAIVNSQYAFFKSIENLAAPLNS